jgi:hypothetical protein
LWIYQDDYFLLSSLLFPQLFLQELFPQGLYLQELYLSVIPSELTFLLED